MTEHGTVEFATKVAANGTYAVTVAEQPTNPSQTCTVTGGTGTVGSSDVTTITVNFTVDTFKVSGTITGLTADGLSLTNTYSGGGGPETISPAANASTFAFFQAVASGQTYAVTVDASPAGLHCAVTSNGSGTIGGADVTDVAIACNPNVVDIAFTGAEDVYVVPLWATSLDVTLEGAQGGSDYASNQNWGGKVTATLAVTGGESLSLFVGGQPGDTSGGFNGGGAGDNAGRGGGGATDIRRGGNTLGDRILVAGGGGGSSYAKDNAGITNYVSVTGGAQPGNGRIHIVVN